ncbi:conserved hypothetical protein [Ricinus communis]|uniref:Uncharacterized protein n=1 Tax=Ricinus communis TaxID=3988 RepID=B9RTJ7_RICCO|nr:conserved hypothetical protein [Ricinus communis]
MNLAVVGNCVEKENHADKYGNHDDEIMVGKIIKIYVAGNDCSQARPPHVQCGRESRIVSLRLRGFLNMCANAKLVSNDLMSNILISIISIVNYKKFQTLCKLMKSVAQEK